MIRHVPLLALGVMLPAAAFGATCTTAAKQNATGHFYAQGGQVIGPDGTPFLARGVNDGNIAGDAQRLIDTFPGLNMVRVPVFNYDDPASFTAAVELLTSAGVVVEFEDHTSSDGQNRGGSTGYIFTGDRLQQELSWYSSMASYYKFNPLVWFGTDNEPSAINPATGQSDPGALSDWQLQTYNAIRNAGNSSPVMLEINGWGDVNSFAEGYNLADYAGMTNVIGDVHDYGWLTHYSTDQGTNNSFLTDAVASLQSRLKTADGPLPVLVGEYGNSTDGVKVDENGRQVVTAVNASGLGSVAWYFGQGNPGDGLLNGDGSLSAYGQQVAGYIAAGGCPAQPAAKDQLVSEVTPALPPIEPLPEPPALPVNPPNAPRYASNVTPPQLPALNVPPGTVRPPDVPAYPVSLPNFTIPVLEPVIPPPGAGPVIQTITAIANRGMTMLASPIGTWLVKMDGSILTGMDAALQGLAPQMAGPVGSLCLLYLGARGVRVAQGDAMAMNNLWFNFVKIIIVIGLATNLGNFDTYVRDLFYTNLPNTLNAAVGGQLVTNGVNGTAATFDNIWAQMWVQISNVYQQAGILDFGSRLSAELCGLTIGAALMAMALVYLLARLLLAIVIVFGPICIACTLFDQTKPIFERWMGKVIALICLQVAGIVLLTILLAADKDFMSQIQPLATAAGTGTFGASGAPAPTLASDLQNLVAMVIWFGMGAFAMYALPAIAYSIGTGVATNASAATARPDERRKLATLGCRRAELVASVSSRWATCQKPQHGLCSRRAVQRFERRAALPPPPPPSLSYATPPALG